MLLSLILGRFLIAGQAKVLFNTISSDGDESAYLALGLALLEEGQVTDGVRPPLYPLLLAPLAERDWAYFTRAKMMTLGLGALTVLVTFLVARALFNVETGLLAAFLLAANREFHLRASTVYADTLLVLFFVAAWYFLIKSFEQRRFAYLAGFFVGLAYLTKGTGTLLLVAWGMVALV
ncbi:MAG: glycosyltransferase family 39 protein, partial [Anaerolineae bacterium]|nr:glycosyltransferase family 39 protein [Anaerolineae bacterium]